jgi:hypothetical protein
VVYTGPTAAGEAGLAAGGAYAAGAAVLESAPIDTARSELAAGRISTEEFEAIVAMERYVWLVCLIERWP